VPDGTVGQGLSRSLADRPASLPTWIAARSGHGRASLIRKRSLVHVRAPDPGPSQTRHGIGLAEFIRGPRCTSGIP
jgi:hypothetical protein